MRIKLIVIFLLIAGAASTPSRAQEFQIAGGGLARDNTDQVVQLSANVARYPAVQVAYTAWRDSKAVSVLYGWRGTFLEGGAGVARVSGFGDEHAAAHLRAGAHAGIFFVSYEVLAVRGDRAPFLLGGVRFTFK